jgi:hypothetical protein
MARCMQAGFICIRGRNGRLKWMGSRCLTKKKALQGGKGRGSSGTRMFRLLSRHISSLHRSIWWWHRKEETWEWSGRWCMHSMGVLEGLDGGLKEITPNSFPFRQHWLWKRVTLNIGRELTINRNIIFKQHFHQLHLSIHGQQRNHLPLHPLHAKSQIPQPDLPTRH